ncbi:MAG: DUF4835 family protein, partial [Bacteroidetes bacterium]|nr:DUF4835 family protein [Bacteroidota bacterium]
YYAYIIIAMDYDSFSLSGGTPYLVKAQKVVANAQNATEKGWKSFDGNKNRYWLVENLLDKLYYPIREFTYKYHRLGLDVMSNNPPQGRSVMMESLEGLKAIHKLRPLSFNMQVLFYAKVDELVNVFKQADPADRTKVSALLMDINPGNSNKYQKILQP